METENLEQTFSSLKIRVHIIILPLVIIATGAGWVLDFFFSEYPLTYSSYLFPILDFWLLFSFIYILVYKKLPRSIELTTLGIVLLIYLVWFTDVMKFNLKAGSQSGGLGEFTNWVPLFFIYIALLFDQKKALIISILTLISTIAIGMVLAITSNYPFHLQTYDSLIQFYISNATYIFALYFLQQLKIAYIQKDTLQYLAHTDFLTKLPNRRLVEDQLEESIVAKQTFSLIIFDIDHFKEINDKHGHDIGDEVLKELAQIIQDNSREKDVVGRWGGEEFIILAKDLSGKQAVIFSDRLRKLIEATPFLPNHNVTASFGVAELRTTDTAHDILKRADVALYLAKDRGRNMVEIII